MRYLKKLIIIIITFILNISLISCTKERTYISTLNEDMMLEIKQAYADKYKTELSLIEIKQFYGGFGDVYVVLVDYQNSQFIKEVTEEIAGC